MRILPARTGTFPLKCGHPGPLDPGVQGKEVSLMVLKHYPEEIKADAVTLVLVGSVQRLQADRGRS